jgi:uncharacterized FlaG/YvyC family protein
MSVIKTLDASENNEEREREKLKIEKEFKKSDKRLAELVGSHDSELTTVATGLSYYNSQQVNNVMISLSDHAIILKNIDRG